MWAHARRLAGLGAEASKKAERDGGKSVARDQVLSEIRALDEEATALEERLAAAEDPASDAPARVDAAVQAAEDLEELARGIAEADALDVAEAAEADRHRAALEREIAVRRAQLASLGGG